MILFIGAQVRELEDEIEALASGREHRRKLKELMNKKELVGDLFNNLRLARQRLVAADGVNDSPADSLQRDESSINATLAQLLMVMERLDAKIGALHTCSQKVFRIDLFEFFPTKATYQNCIPAGSHMVSFSYSLGLDQACPDVSAAAHMTSHEIQE